MPRERSSSRIPGIEGLRGLAALLIVVHHVRINSVPLDERIGSSGVVDTLLADLALGVTLFFVLSGFLLYRPYVAAVLDGRRVPSVRRYLRSRLTRILPAYWVILFAGFFVLGTNSLGPDDTLGFRDLAQTFTLTHQLTPGTVGAGLGPSWSLAVEVAFYALLPVFGLLALRLARRARSVRGRVLAVVAPAALPLVIGVSGKLVAEHVVTTTESNPFTENWHSIIVKSFWGQADLFTFGMLVAVLYVLVDTGRVRMPSGWRPVAVAGVLGCAFYAYPLGWDALEQDFRNLLAAGGSALVLLLVLLPGRRGLALRVLDHPAAVAVGTGSFSLFLWNDQVIIWLERHGLTLPGVGGFFANLAIALAVCAPLTWATYRWVEKPGMALGRSRRPRATAARPPDAAGRASAQLSPR